MTAAIEIPAAEQLAAEQRIEEAHARQLDAERLQQFAREAVYVADNDVAMYVTEQCARGWGSQFLILTTAQQHDLIRRNHRAITARAQLDKANELARMARDAHAAAQDAQQLVLGLRGQA
jgi:hypothetical protein